MKWRRSKNKQTEVAKADDVDDEDCDSCFSVEPMAGTVASGGTITTSYEFDTQKKRQTAPTIAKPVKSDSMQPASPVAKPVKAQSVRSAPSVPNTANSQAVRTASPVAKRVKSQPIRSTSPISKVPNPAISQAVRTASPVAKQVKSQPIRPTSPVSKQVKSKSQARRSASPVAKSAKQQPKRPTPTVINPDKPQPKQSTATAVNPIKPPQKPISILKKNGSKKWHEEDYKRISIKKNNREYASGEKSTVVSYDDSTRIGDDQGGSVNYAWDDIVHTTREMTGYQNCNDSADASICTAVDFSFFSQSVTEFFFGSNEDNDAANNNRTTRKRVRFPKRRANSITTENERSHAAVA